MKIRYQWFMFSSLVLAVGCGMIPGKKKGHNAAAPIESTPADTDDKKSDDATQDNDVSLTAFEKSTYPILQEHCANCHATDISPLIADADIKNAHQAIIDGQKVNFDAVELSRLYLRLAKENHNCWSKCEEDAAAMKTALTEWATAVKASPDPSTPPTLMTAELSLGEAIAVDPLENPATIVLEGEAATLTAPMVKLAEPKASGGNAIYVPTGNGGTVAATATNVGSAVWNLNVKQAGTFQLWVRLRGPSATNSGLFISIDNGAFAAWDMAETGTEFKWFKVETVVNNAPKLLTFQLTAGAHRLEIRRREENTQIDLIALTSDPKFEGESATPGHMKRLHFPLADLLGGQAVSFEIDVMDFDASAYKFKNPKLVVDSGNIHVAGIRIYMNGQSDPQNATYTLVDTTVAAPGGSLSPAALIALKALGPDQDKFSIGFDVLEKK